MTGLPLLQSRGTGKSIRFDLPGALLLKTELAPPPTIHDAAASTVLGQTPSEILISFSDMPELMVAAA